MDKKLLHTAIFGFNKKDVYDYISTLSERNSSKLSAKDNETAHLKGELNELKALAEKEA